MVKQVGNTAMAGAVDKIRQFSAEDEAWFISLQEDLQKFDEAARYRAGREDGIALGRKEGKDEGIKEGIQKGIQKGKEEERKIISKKIQQMDLPQEKIEEILNCI